MASEPAPGTSPERELLIAMQRASELARTVAGAVSDAVSRGGVLDGGALDDARAAASELLGALGMASEIAGELRAELPTVVDLDLVDALAGGLDDALALARDTARALARAMGSEFARRRVVVFARELNHALDRALDDELAFRDARDGAGQVRS
jgi:hypothetical protein